MTDLNVELKLDRIHCHDEGDGPGSAEPYLWTVFFKIDGDTLVVNTDGPAPPFLQGAPTVVGTPGNHGNLGDTDVDEGDDVAVPAIIGEYRTILKPIPLTTPILGISEVGGMMGCIAVLMEEDNTSNSAIGLGHEALDRNVRDRLAELLGTLSISKQEPSEEDITAMSDQIGEAVEDAVGHGVSVLDWIVALLLLGFGLHRILVNRHPRFGGMRVGPRDLTLWSLLMASAHGAGLMVVPLLPRSGPAGGDHAHHVMQQAALVDSQVLQGILAAAIHTAGYLLVTGAIAAVVYYKVGLRLLRTAWINLDLIWAGALIATAVVILL